jgi:Protein of unknown function (DUF551)
MTEAPVCHSCGDEYRMEFGLEPTKYCNECAHAIVDRLEGEREWIKVQEKMPPDTKTVLVWCPERRNTYSANWVSPFWYHFSGGGGSRVEQMVTHWMPLPDPPTETK